MRVVVNWTLCDGNGACEAEAPTVFQLDDDDSLTVLQEEPGDDLEEQVEAAVSACPKRALSLTR
jgi:ferredoxin